MNPMFVTIRTYTVRGTKCGLSPVQWVSEQYQMPYGVRYDILRNGQVVAERVKPEDVRPLVRELGQGREVLSSARIASRLTQG
jgi:hypothetical protein